MAIYNLLFTSRHLHAIAKTLNEMNADEVFTAIFAETEMPPLEELGALANFHATLTDNFNAIDPTNAVNVFVADDVQVLRQDKKLNIVINDSQLALLRYVLKEVNDMSAFFQLTQEQLQPFPTLNEISHG